MYDPQLHGTEHVEGRMVRLPKIEKARTGYSREMLKMKISFLRSSLYLVVEWRSSHYLIAVVATRLS